MTKDSLIKGTIILTAAALVARFLGIFHKIPLVYILGDAGMGSYSIAFNLYQTLLVIATIGIPTALGKYISEYNSLGQYAQAQQIYQVALRFSISAGVVIAIGLYLGAPYYAEFIAQDPQSKLAIQAIAPALLLFPTIAIMRGYFQGRQNMMPNGISQVLEQVFRTIVAIFSAYFLLQFSLEWAIAGASLGTVAGSVMAIIVMIYFMARMRRQDRRDTSVPSSQIKPSSDSVTIVARDQSAPQLLKKREIFRKLLFTSIPIVVFSATVTFIYNLDSSMMIPLLKDQYGKELSLDLIGILGGRAQSLAGIPVIFAIAISQSIVPIISAAYSTKNADQLSHQTKRAMQLSILSGLPMILMIIIAARPLDVFLFGYENSAFGIENGPHMIALLSAMVMFQILQLTSGSILIGMSKTKVLMWAILVGIILKVVGNIVLSDWLGVYGIILATGVCYFVITWANMYSLKKEVSFVIFGKRWFQLVMVTGSILGLGLFLQNWLYQHVHLFPDKLNQGFIAMLLCAFVIILFPILILIGRVMTKEDIAGFPEPFRSWVQKAQRMYGNLFSRP